MRSITAIPLAIAGALLLAACAPAYADPAVERPIAFVRRRARARRGHQRRRPAALSRGARGRREHRGLAGLDRPRLRHGRRRGHGRRGASHLRFLRLPGLRARHASRPSTRSISPSSPMPTARCCASPTACSPTRSSSPARNTGRRSQSTSARAPSPRRWRRRRGRGRADQQMDLRQDQRAHQGPRDPSGVL